MLKNTRNLKDFYAQVLSVNHIFDTVLENNAVLEKQYLKDNPQKQIEEKKDVICPEQKYIFHYVKSDGYRKIVEIIFYDMQKYQFSKTSSVPLNVNVNSNLTSYDIHAQIGLDQHTIDCVVCCIEICEDEKLPQTILENGVLLCLLHDFGKEPKLANEFRQDDAEAHNITSANYFKKKFRKYIDVLISKDTYLTIIEVLENHHNKGADETMLLKLLRRADISAREKEEIFILNKNAAIKDKA